MGIRTLWLMTWATVLTAVGSALWLAHHGGAGVEGDLRTSASTAAFVLPGQPTAAGPAASQASAPAPTPASAATPATPPAR